MFQSDSIVKTLRMSATELLEQVKALPATERSTLLEAMIALELLESSVATPARPSERIVWPDIEARARRTFGDRVFPNPILLEREEEDR